jgi:hypothetical protein
MTMRRVVRMQLDVVADAAAERAGGIRDDARFMSALGPDAPSATSTSHPFDTGVPVASVEGPMRRLVRGPYGAKIMPGGTLPATQVNVASPCADRTTTSAPSATPIDFMSSGFIVSVLTIARISAASLPALIATPCLVVRPVFMTKR